MKLSQAIQVLAEKDTVMHVSLLLDFSWASLMLCSSLYYSDIPTSVVYFLCPSCCSVRPLRI